MITAGAASKIINNEIGTVIQGATVDNTVQSIRDDLEANALLLRSKDEAVLLVSCDVGTLLPEYIAEFRMRMADAADVPEDGVIIGCSHTHTGPSTLPTNPRKEVDKAYYDRLGNWLEALAAEAAADERPARVAWGKGQAQIGYNRRVCWADGTHTMHRRYEDKEFIGLEGPDNPEHIALFVVDHDDDLIAILHNNGAHPTSFYGANFLSADYPGAARSYLREVLGTVPVLLLNGAFGDMSNNSQQAPGARSETREQRMERQAHLMAGETLRILHEAALSDDPVIAHRQETIELDVTLPDSDALEASRDLLKRADAGEDVDIRDLMFAHGRVLLQEDFGSNSVDTLRIHALRIGELGIVSNPTELFCQFGLDIKRRSPAAATAIMDVADGYSGYCPTMAGTVGGGYSGEPLWWTRLAPGAGDRIVDTACRLLWELWRRR